MAIIKTDNSHYTNIANTIRSRIGAETQFKPSEIPQGVESVYNAGYEKGKAEGGTAKPEQEKTVNINKNGTTEVLPDENKVLSKVTVNVDVKGEAVDYMPYLTGPIKFVSDISEITDDIYLDLSNATSLYGMFNRLALSCSKVTVKLSNKCTSLQGAFWGAIGDLLQTIEIVGDTSSVTSFYRAFSDRFKLERILGELDFSSVTNTVDWLMNANHVKEIYFKPNTIKISISFSVLPDLTDESIEAIVNGYADMTGQTSPVLTVHPNVKAKIEANSEWLNTLINKNVTLA